LVVGCLFGEPELFRKCCECAFSPEVSNRGARHLAAMAQYPSYLRRRHRLMCFLTVNANIIFPMNTYMTLIKPLPCLIVYVVSAWLPAVWVRHYVLRSRQFRKPAITVLPLPYDLHNTEKSTTVLWFHIFTSLRHVIFAGVALLFFILGHRTSS